MTSLWQGIGAVVYAGGYLWTCDALPTGFGNSNDIPPSVNMIHVLDPTTLPYPKIVKTIDMSQYIGPYIKNARKIKRSPDGTKIYACTNGWHGQYSDRGVHGNIDTSFGTQFFTFADRPSFNGFSPDFIGLTITISGAADPNNNGTFPINSGGTVDNPLATTDANNGSLIWHLNTPGQSVIGSPCGYVFIIDTATQNVLGLAQLKNGIIADGSIFGQPTDLGDGSAARDCLDDGAGNLWVVNASAGGAGSGITLLEKFNIASVISNGPTVQTPSVQQISVTRHAEEICFDSGYIWTASAYVGNTFNTGPDLPSTNNRGIVSRIDPGTGTISVYQDTTVGIFGMMSDGAGRSPFPGALYAFTTNTFTPRNSVLRFDPANFPSASFRTHIQEISQTDGGGMCKVGNDLWVSSRSASSSQAVFFRLDPSDLTIYEQFNTFSSVLSDSGLGCWCLEYDGTYVWGARRGFSGRVNSNFINCGLVQVIPGDTVAFQNAAQDDVMQLWNGQFLGWIMQARSTFDGLLYTWGWPYPDFTGLGYPGPGSPEEIAVDEFSPLSSLSVVMQAVSSADSSLVTWVAPTEDFAGDLFPGPGSPLEITVLSRNLVVSPTNLQVTMQAVDSITNEIVTWNSDPNSIDFGGFGYPGPGTPSEIAVHQVKYNF